MKKQIKRPLHWTERATLGFLLKHLLSGVFGGLVFGALILYYDVSKIWTMISSSPDGIVYLIMLFFSLFITFGSIGMGWGIFSLAQERDEAPKDHTYY